MTPSHETIFTKTVYTIFHDKNLTLMKIRYKSYFRLKSRLGSRWVVCIVVCSIQKLLSVKTEETVFDLCDPYIW